MEIKCNDNRHFCMKLVLKHWFLWADRQDAITRSSLESVSQMNWEWCDIVILFAMGHCAHARESPLALKMLG